MYGQWGLQLTEFTHNLLWLADWLLDVAILQFFRERTKQNL